LVSSLLDSSFDLWRDVALTLNMTLSIVILRERSDRRIW